MARPPEPLSPERIYAAALALTDEGGLEALSMRRLGVALGVDPMAIYHHVPNKQALFHGVVRSVFSALPMPDAGRWDDELRQWARSYRDVVAAHPALVLTIVVDQAAVAVAAAAATGALHAAVARSGVAPDDVEVCADVVVDYVNGAVLACASGPRGEGLDAELRATLDAAFEVGLDVVVGGIAARAATRGL